MFEVTQSNVFNLTGELRQAMADDLLRRFVMQKELYHRCPDRGCRRLRACAAAGRPCVCIGSMPPISNKDAQRLKWDFKHNPPRG